MPRRKFNYAKAHNYRHKSRSKASKAIAKYKPRKISVYAIRKIAKQAISRDIETKTKQYSSNSYNVYPSNSTSFGTSIFPCTPYTSYLQIDQGTGQGDRIGNKIKLKNLSIKGTLWALPYDVVFNPIPQPVQVIIRFFYNRGSTILTPSSLTGFLQNGNSSQNLNNDLTDFVTPVNNEQYKVFCVRKFKIGFANNEGTGSYPVGQYFANNDFKLNANFKVNLTKYAVKNVMYADGAGQPRVRGIFCSMQVVAASGGNLPSNYIGVKAAWTLDCDYQDA